MKNVEDLNAFIQTTDPKSGRAKKQYSGSMEALPMQTQIRQGLIAGAVRNLWEYTQLNEVYRISHKKAMGN